MNLKINKIFLILVICLALLFIFCLKVDAASATITVDKTTVEVGKPVKITVSGKGVQWNLKLKVDGQVLKTDSELENYEANKNINFSVTYTPKTEGTKKVTLEGSVTEFSDGSTIKSFASKSITVKEKETTTDKKEDTTTDKNTSTTNKDTTTPEKPKEKSNNAYLSTLGVTPKEYDFSGFSKTKTEYSVTVPKNVDSLKVLYKTADSNAKVTVSGNSGFEVGSDNKITIKVTAEDGKTTKNYNIKVTQLAEEEEKPGNLIEDEEGLYLTKLNIDAASLSPEFSKDVFSYTATLNDVNIKDLEIKAEANKKDAKIDISGHTNLAEGENTVNIILTMDGSEIQTVYQVIVTANFTEDIITSSSEEGENTGATDLIGKIKKYAGIAIGAIILIVVVVIVLIIMLIKENKRIKEDEELDDDETEKTRVKEYNIYENDDNEFLDNDIKKDNFIESLYNQRNGTLDTKDLTEEEKETLEEINKQTEKIFEEKIEGKSVEYISNEMLDNPLEGKNRKRGKGKHSL